MCLFQRDPNAQLDPTTELNGSRPGTSGKTMAVKIPTMVVSAPPLIYRGCWPEVFGRLDDVDVCHESGCSHERIEKLT